MSGNLQVGNNQITRLNDPSADDHAVNQKYVKDIIWAYIETIKWDVLWIWNDNRIMGLTNDILYLTEAVNKQYVDSVIIKGNIKASHSSKNVFKYFMDDVNE